MKPSDSRGTLTPLCAQVILKLPYKFGAAPWEKEFSFVYARLNAFSSRACLGSSFSPVSTGTVVRGLIEKADSDYDTAQLVGWAPASAARLGRFNRYQTGLSPNRAEWKLLAPDTFFNEGLCYDTHALYQLPTLHQKCFPAYPTEYINHTLICQPDMHRERLDCEGSIFYLVSFPSPSPGKLLRCCRSFPSPQCFPFRRLGHPASVHHRCFSPRMLPKSTQLPPAQ